MNWDEAFGCREPVAGTPEAVGTARPGLPEADLERLIEGKNVDAFTAARYLNLSKDHVIKLAQKGKLTRVGEGKAVKVSTESLRRYKGTLP